MTNIDFREAKQFRIQWSGVENPRRVTYKLPSYSTCLKAQIRPKDYPALREYYELLTKDEKLAKMNEKHLLKEVIKDVSSQAKGQPTTLAMMSKANI